ncbi:MAG: YicC/YloC family endoribonuclease [Pseudomonadota bacterium]
MNAISSLKASVVSMTGFARGGDALGDHGWSWEIRSVNARGLDVRMRLPPGLDQIEPTLREAVTRRCARGTVNVALDLRRTRAAPGFRINQSALDGLLALQAALGARVDQSPLRLDALLHVRGLVEEAEPDGVPADDAALKAALVASFERILGELDTVRRSEGGRLAAVLAGHVDSIATLTETAAASAALQPALVAERLKRQLATLLEERVAVAPDRLAAEVALIASRADVTEELDGCAPMSRRRAS